MSVSGGCLFLSSGLPDTIIRLVDPQAEEGARRAGREGGDLDTWDRDSL